MKFSAVKPTAISGCTGLVVKKINKKPYLMASHLNHNKLKEGPKQSIHAHIEANDDRSICKREGSMFAINW